MLMGRCDMLMGHDDVLTGRDDRRRDGVGALERGDGRGAARHRRGPLSLLTPLTC